MSKNIRKQIGYIGLGKMGSSMVLRLKQEKWDTIAFDANTRAVKRMQQRGVKTVDSLKELVEHLSTPRIVWIMVPAFAKASAGKPARSPVDDVVNGLLPYLQKGDILIDGGNSFYESSIRRAKKLAKKGVSFLDVGISGGPQTVRDGKPAVMIGGEKSAYLRAKAVFESITRKESYGYMGKSGAGHFVKMVHNGIEYGIMQSLAEGFTVMKKSPFRVDLEEVARVYNNGSVIESRLTKWMLNGYKKYGQDLKPVAGSVEHTGEGEWTVKTAKKLSVPLPVIKAAFDFRVQSKEKPSYTGKILMMLRNQFGGHDIKGKR